MKKILNPDRKTWPELAQRPKTDPLAVGETVNQVFDAVGLKGDEALKEFTLKFDRVALNTLAVGEEVIKMASEKVSTELKQAIAIAKNNITQFHIAQKEGIKIIATTPGVNCWRESRPIEKVGIYIPGGSAPLFSTVLMLGIPAKLAGCKEIILCTPPDSLGDINPVILYTAQLVGISKIFAVGGIQAIAALSLGTQSIPLVDKIFGPGNQYVTAAKQKAQALGLAIDMPAGPSEVLIIADKTANPAFVAADLLSQAEHGADSQVILLADNESIIDQTLAELAHQAAVLPRFEIIKQALENSKAILFNNLSDALAFSNLYAPEHLILATEKARALIAEVSNAGSVFLGNYSCESAGDYASGTNHTLPTNGYARNYSGVSLDSFIKKITFQEISQEGIQNLGPAISLMAEAEQLMAHQNAVNIRLKAI
ncbi:MAG: histidinol dehydrogenase [Sphingobacteriaceae bacterium]